MLGLVSGGGRAGRQTRRDVGRESYSRPRMRFYAYMGLGVTLRRCAARDFFAADEVEYVYAPTHRRGGSNEQIAEKDFR